MKSFKICIFRFGYADVTANNVDEALEKAKVLGESDFEWEPVSDDLLEDATAIKVD